jgi:hypothetical protein
MIPEPEDTFSMPSSHVVLDQVDIAFDDPRAVAQAGLLLPATLAERLGIEQALLSLGVPWFMPQTCPRYAEKALGDELA